MKINNSSKSEQNSVKDTGPFDLMANWKCVFERRSTLVGKEFIGRLDITKRQVKLMACRIENRIGLF